MSRKQVSQERKVIYYVGLTLIVVGFLTFGSIFVSAVLETSGPFGVRGGSNNFPLRAVSGMGMAILGSILSAIGKRGLAGAGLILDPEQARTDVEPWSRMGGGMLKDALDEADINLGGKAAELPFDEQLRRLHRLREDGIVSEAEYQAKKKQILESA